jgi:glycolate oxidase FAD binding subunit
MPGAATCLIDDFGPLPVHAPATAADIGELVRQAAANNQAIYPIGGRTMLDLGRPPTRDGWAVSLGKLDQIIDYPARDMTVTVQAGIPIASLQATLTKENQRLPVDVPLAEQATLGGCVAANVSGPHRYGFGTLRDYVIGISFINDRGEEIKAGGRVVKNVAGYDICKLMVGSLGTLGVITHVTLKLKPLPPERAVLLVECEETGINAFLEKVHHSRTRPVCLDILNPAKTALINNQWRDLFPPDAWVGVVGLEDDPETVAWQVQQLLTELSPGCSLEARVGVKAGPVWEALVEQPAKAICQFAWKANMLPSAVAQFCSQAARLPGDPAIQAHAGNGIVLGQDSQTATPARAAEILQSLQEWTAAAKGNVVVVHAPAAWKKTLPVWGKPRGDAKLMQTVKKALDPSNLFNPGRFLDAA